MESIADDRIGERVVVFSVRYFLRGTIMSTFLDDMGCTWFDLGPDTTQWDDCTEKGPKGKEHAFGAIRIPQTAIGLGIQLERDKGWKPPESWKKPKIEEAVS